MRYLIPIVVLLLVGCNGRSKKPEPPPDDRNELTGKGFAKGKKTLKLLSLRSELEKLPEESRAGAEAALREILANLGGRYELTDGEEAEIVLQPVLRRFTFREIGSGSAFTMRDLGVDPGSEFLIGTLDLAARIQMGGETMDEAISVQIKGGEGTPGVVREDRDGDGRSEVHVGPEAHVALMKPALRALAARILARTHPLPTEPEGGGE